MSKNLNVAVVGATGMVGQEFIKILQEIHFPVGELRLFASEKSSGEKIMFNGKGVEVRSPEKGCFKGCDVAFFSAGNPISKEWGPIATSEGAFVIDNSSAFRMDSGIPLVVPEVNAHCIPKGQKPQIIANPNCSTIQLVVALKPLQDRFLLKSVTVATYQSVSGAGKAGVDELVAQTKAHLDGKELTPTTFAHNIAFNNLPHIDVFDETGFTAEERKVVNETRKIMELPQLDVSCHAVRTPTLNGHSEAVWVELEKPATKEDIVAALKAAPGIIVQDNPAEKTYPQNRKASGQDPVYVGRIRQDLFNKKRWLFWVVADNVRKGAALNGIQIAKHLF